MRSDRRAWNPRMSRMAAAIVALTALWGCPPSDPPAEDVPENEDLDPAPDLQSLDDSEARAELIDGEGNQVGALSFTGAEQEAVRVHGSLDIPQLAGAERGFHVHEVGACVPPDFESAGDHFNPHGTPHGGPDAPPDQRHAGDLGNVTFDEEGRAEIEVVDSVISLEGGAESIRGLSILVHEGQDDLVTQPSGDAGDPAACGVIEA